jgi:hypothetical protein
MVKILNIGEKLFTTLACFCYEKVKG